MSKKNRKNRETAPAVDQAAVEQHIAETPEVAGASEQVAETTPEQVADAVAATVTEQPKTRIRYAVIEGRREFKFRRGFETVLNAELLKGGGTIDELTARLLESGEYQRVAPAAAAARPEKPVGYLLRQWTTAKLLHATELENTPEDGAAAEVNPTAEDGIPAVAATE